MQSFTILLLVLCTFGVFVFGVTIPETPALTIYSNDTILDDDDYMDRSSNYEIWEHDHGCGMDDDEVEKARRINFLHPSGRHLRKHEYMKDSKNAKHLQTLSNTFISSIFGEENVEEDDETSASNSFMSLLGINQAMTIASKPSSNKFEIPKCGVTVCGNPKLWKKYQQTTNQKSYKVKLEWLYVKSDEEWRNAKETVERMTKYLNNVYSENAKLTFKSTIKVFNLTNTLAEKLGVSSPEKLRGMKVHKFDCSLREDDGRGLCVTAIDLMVALRGEDWQSHGAFQILPVVFTREGLNGFGKFPWASDHGMIVVAHRALQPDQSTLPHEMGHCFGLLHTFSGYSSDTCSACAEKNPEGDEATGDLIPDTPAMPLWHPQVDEETCDKAPPNDTPPTCFDKWSTNTPNENIMSYGTCRKILTPDQVARIHCFLNHVIAPNKFWEESKT